MTLQLAAFEVDRVQWGIPVLYVREVLRRVRCSPAPLAPDYVSGQMNLRGRIATVVDLGRRVGTWSAECSQRKACVILKTDLELDRIETGHAGLDRTGQDIIGLLVDEVLDVAEFADGAVEPCPAHINHDYGQFVDGVLKLDSGLLLVLALGPVLEP